MSNKCTIFLDLNFVSVDLANIVKGTYLSVVTWKADAVYASTSEDDKLISELIKIAADHVQDGLVRSSVLRRK